MENTAPRRDWVGEYAKSHQNPVNRACHSIGIPMIAVSLVLAIAWLFLRPSALGWVALALFVLGWVFQFVGHAYEHKAPEFFRDPRFLLVGLRWWLAKMQGKA